MSICFPVYGLTNSATVFTLAMPVLSLDKRGGLIIFVMRVSLNRNLYRLTINCIYPQCHVLAFCVFTYSQDVYRYTQGILLCSYDFEHFMPNGVHFWLFLISYSLNLDFGHV